MITEAERQIKEAERRPWFSITEAPSDRKAVLDGPLAFRWQGALVSQPGRYVTEGQHPHVPIKLCLTTWHRQTGLSAV